MLKKRFVATVLVTDRNVAENSEPPIPVSSVTRDAREDYVRNVLSWGSDAFEEFSFEEIPSRIPGRRQFAFALSASDERIAKNVGWIPSGPVGDEECLDYVQREL